MRRIRVQQKDPATPVTSFLPEVDPALRDTPDPDPVVEAMVERMRSSLQGLVALDEYGRPVPWRQVVRIALGPVLSELQQLHDDADAGQVIVLPADDAGEALREDDSVAAASPAVRAADLARRPVGGRHHRPA